MGPERFFGPAVVTLAALLLPGGCAEEPCPVCESPQQRGELANPSLTEVSGVAASGVHEGVLYGHNDSGDTARLFVFSRSGEDLGILDLDNADNNDWEDIAQGPCASGSCLFVGDIGDNLLNRTQYAIYIVTEPATLMPGVQRAESQRIDFVYEDGPHDAEVLLVHPRTGAVTVVAKAESGPASIYELPVQLVPGERHTATWAGEVEPPKGSAKFTGGAVHPDATGVLLRTKSRMFYYPISDTDTVSAALTHDACAIPLAEEIQGEAVTWVDGGDRILTVGEGAGAPLNEVSCNTQSG